MKIKDPKTSCKLGQGSKCCAFLVAGGNGFECAMDDQFLNSHIKLRIKNGTMNAKGIGNWKECEYHE